MSVLNRDEIARRFGRGELILHPRRDEKGEFEIEPASYDMTSGVFIWRDPDTEHKKGCVQTHYYNPNEPFDKQKTITMQSGQMVFVITHEEIMMPTDLCGTVYSRNKLARDGVLALNAGHVDPGYHGPIAIRLINLRAVPCVLRLGDPIYTIVFHNVQFQEHDKRGGHKAITMRETVDKYTESANVALANALHDISLTRDFIRKEDFGDCVRGWAMKRALGLTALFIAAITFLATAVALVPFIKEAVKKWADSP